MNDAQAKVVITADGGYRRGQIVPLKRNADKALEAFHVAAFSPKVSLTQSDLKSLDGSPVRRRERAGQSSSDSSAALSAAAPM